MFFNLLKIYRCARSVRFDRVDRPPRSRSLGRIVRFHRVVFVGSSSSIASIPLFNWVGRRQSSGSIARMFRFDRVGSTLRYEDHPLRSREDVKSPAGVC